MRATIEWSYDLLTEQEQALLAHLAVFAGGCSYEAAEEIADADPDTLQSLLDKSLLRKRESHSMPRYWMLETIREYAAEQLAETGDPQRVWDRHLAYYLQLVEEAEPELTGPDQRQWFERLALEQGNVREALAFACDHGDGERALMLAGTIWRFWWSRGQVDEASRWYERAFAVGDNASETARARGLFGAAHMAEARGDALEAREQFQEAADALRRIGSTRWLILALAHLAGTFNEDPDQAQRIYREALALAEGSGDVRGAAIVKGNYAELVLTLGDDQRAAQLRQEALEGHRALGDVYGVATSLASLAAAALRRGDLAAAASTLRESLQLSLSIEDTLTLSWTLALAGALVLARGDSRTAALLCAADDALLKAHGIEPDPHLAETEQVVRSTLGDELDDLWAAGRNLDLTAAVDVALDALSDA